jgi:hypothetical protein
LYKNSFADH